MDDNEPHFDRSERPNPQSARFVISLCQDVLATTFRTLYQLHAVTPDERFRRDKQAEKLVATWGTCELWMQLWPFDNFETNPDFANTGTTLITLPEQLSACVKAVANLKEEESYDLGSGFRSFPDILTSLSPPHNETPSMNAFPPSHKTLPKLPILHTPLPDLVIDNIIGFVESSDLRDFWDHRSLSNASLVCKAWNMAVRSKYASVFAAGTVESLLKSYLYETHFRTILGSKTCSLRELKLNWIFPFDDNEHRFRAALYGLCKFSALWKLQFSDVDIEAETVVRVIARIPELVALEISSCTFRGSIELDTDDGRRARQHLGRCVSVSITMPDVHTDLTILVLGSIGPALRFLYLSLSLPDGIRLNFPLVEQLTYIYRWDCEDQPTLPSLPAWLPAVKHLYMGCTKSLRRVIPCGPGIGGLRLLEGNAWADTEEELEDFFAALSLLPSLDILDVRLNSDNLLRLNPTPMLKYIRGKGSQLKGIRLDLEFVPLEIVEAVSLSCPHLTHLAILFEQYDIDGAQILERFGLELYAERCPKLRKIALMGRFTARMDEWLRKMSENLNTIRPIGIKKSGYSFFDTNWWYS